MSPSAPISLIVRAEIANLGTLAAGQFKVTFYEGNPQSGGVAKATRLVSGAPARHEASPPVVEATWTTAAGAPGQPREIYVRADSTNAIAESSETNNIAHRAIIAHAAFVSYVPRIFRLY